MTPPAIPDRSTLEARMNGARFLLFKHSPICPVSARAFAAYREYLEAHPGVDTGWLDVVGQRELSRHVAAVTGVLHESPQAIVLSAGRALWHASHRAITAAALEAAMRTDAAP